MRYVTRRKIGALTLLPLAGCIGGENEVDPEGSIEVHDQRGQGEELAVESAKANVEFRLVADYDGKSAESSIVSPSEEISVFSLDPPIETQQTVTVEMVSTNGEVLASSTIQYTTIPPGPELTIEEAREVIQERIGFAGPWMSTFEAAEVESAEPEGTDGYTVQFEMIHSWATAGGWEDREQKTRNHISRLATAFLEAFYTSEYEIISVQMRLLHYLGDDDTGDPILEASGQVVMSASAAEQVDWDRFLDHGTFPAGLNEAADEYTYNYIPPN